MVGIVVVSHSLDLARAAVGLALQMVNGPAPRIEIAAGTSDDRLGTDAAAVAEAITAADDGEGVVVIMDLGSAVLSAELALELLSEPSNQIRLVPAAFVEGIFAAVISAAGGGQLDAVARDAEEALDAKAAQRGRTEPPTAANVSITRPAIVAKATIVNRDGIHARPAALIVEALTSLDAQVTIATEHAAPVSARSPTALMSLGTRAGDVLRIEADGAGAEAAVDHIVALPDPGHPFVLLAVDLAPVDAAGLDATRCLAIVVEEGGPTSHTAIIARSLGIPAVVAARGATAIPDGALLLVDGSTGEVIEDPTTDQRATAATPRRLHREKVASPGSTADGHRVALLANIGSDQDATAALECGAEGIGLYRTELSFLERVAAPSIAEQVAVYRSVFARFVGRRVVVRTLDAGSDKPMPFLGHDAEPNPALGVRGFRLAAFHPEMLRDQLKAITEAAAAESAEVWVMAPMITTVDEARTFAGAARAAGQPIIGVMIETPAAAVLAEQILAEVDFVSIGTNDLAQYAFAADRQSTSLASLNDPWQPALLRMIEMVATAASSSGKPIGICGEAAADAQLALVLTGLGISSLSMAPGALAEVGRSLSAVTLEICRQAARAACESGSPASAQEVVRGILKR